MNISIFGWDKLHNDSNFKDNKNQLVFSSLLQIIVKSYCEMLFTITLNSVMEIQMLLVIHKSQPAKLNTTR